MSEMREETIIKVLNRYPCSTAVEIAKFAWQEHNVDMSPSIINGLMRTMKKQAIVGSSKNDRNTQVYWLV